MTTSNNLPKLHADRGNLRDKLLSVVLPVYNEEVVLPQLAEQLRMALKLTGARYEILFVNDGSRDHSSRILDELAAADPAIRVLHLSRNFGHQAAVQAGLTHAVGDAVILMDSDLQDEPRAILNFVRLWQQGSDVVYALRRERKEAWWKRFLFDTFHQLLARVATTKLPADAGNFSLMDRNVAQQIVALGESDRYLPGLRAWVGFRQTGVEVERNARYDATPRVSLRGLIRLAKTAIFSFSSLPLTIFARIGYAATGLFCILATYTLWCRFVTGTAIPGWSSHVLTGSFFGALNALGISMLGEYVVRIYDQVRGRPLFLVARIVNGAAVNETITQSAQRAAAFDDAAECEKLLRASRALLDQVLAAGQPIAEANAKNNSAPKPLCNSSAEKNTVTKAKSHGSEK